MTTGPPLTTTATGPTDAGEVPPHARPDRRSPLRTDRDFRALWSGDAVSQFGSQVTEFVLPLLMVTTVGASGVQVGVLQALYMGPFFVLPLFVGVWLERRPKRPVMIAMDLTRFALVLSIPLAALFGALSLWQVYLVAVVGGAMTVVYDVAATSYLPLLVPARQLPAANSALSVNQAAGGTVGPGVAGWLVHLFGAPATLVFDALSYLTSANALLLVRHREVRVPATARPSARRELVEGLRFLLRSRPLRALAGHAGLYNAGAAVMNVSFLLYFVRDLRHGSADYGTVMVAGGLGAILGAVVAPALIRRFGFGPAFAGVLVFSTGPYFLLATAHGSATDLAVCGAVFFVGTAGASAGSVIAVTIRQRLTPATLFARVNATYRLISYGLLASGATGAGLLVDSVGARATLLAAPCVLVVSAIPVYTRSIRGIRQLDDPEPPPEG